MADQFIIEAVLDGELQRIGRVLQKLENPRELMFAIGGRLVANTQQRFDTKTDPNGLAWLPLADSTKKRLGPKPVGSMLDRLGYMLGSLEPHASEQDVEVGFSRPYAKFHELGTKHMPRRGMLTSDPVAGTLGKQDQQDVIEELEQFLADAFK